MDQSTVDRSAASASAMEINTGANSESDSDSEIEKVNRNPVSTDTTPAASAASFALLVEMFAGQSLDRDIPCMLEECLNVTDILNVQGSCKMFQKLFAEHPDLIGRIPRKKVQADFYRRDLIHRNNLGSSIFVHMRFRHLRRLQSAILNFTGDRSIPQHEANEAMEEIAANPRLTDLSLICSHDGAPLVNSLTLQQLARSQSIKASSRMDAGFRDDLKSIHRLKRRWWAITVCTRSAKCLSCAY